MTNPVRWRRIAKFLVALAIPVAQTVQAALTDDTITSNEWTKIGMALAGALLVWLVPNSRPVTREDLARQVDYHSQPTRHVRREQERRVSRRRNDPPGTSFP
jgi:hypothetical protein